MPSCWAIRQWLVIALLSLAATATVRAEEPKDMIDRGHALQSEGRVAEGEDLLRRAVALLEAAVAADPKAAESQFLLGRALFYIRRDAEAMRRFDRAIELSPATAGYHFLRAVACWYAGDLDRAHQGMSRVIELDPKMDEAWFDRGRIRSAQGKKDEALADYTRALSLNPVHAGALYNTGVLLVEVGKDDEALEYFGKAQKADPKNVDAFYNAGQVHQNHHRAKEALATFLAAAEIAPEDFQILKKVVQAHFALGQYAEAQPFRARLMAVREKSTDPQVHDVGEFCFDQFNVGDLHVLAYETFDKSGDLYYHYTFKIAGADGKVLRTVNLECSAVSRELGTPFILGADEGNLHRTYNVGWKALPAYDQLKPVVIQAIEGKLAAAASSQPK